MSHFTEIILLAVPMTTHKNEKLLMQAKHFIYVSVNKNTNFPYMNQFDFK